LEKGAPAAEPEQHSLAALRWRGHKLMPPPPPPPPPLLLLLLLLLGATAL
jgi:hypothetical protein